MFIKPTPVIPYQYRKRVIQTNSHIKKRQSIWLLAPYQTYITCIKHNNVWLLRPTDPCAAQEDLLIGSHSQRHGHEPCIEDLGHENVWGKVPFDNCAKLLGEVEVGVSCQVKRGCFFYCRHEVVLRVSTVIGGEGFACLNLQGGVVWRALSKSKTK